MNATLRIVGQRLLQALPVIVLRTDPSGGWIGALVTRLTLISAIVGLCFGFGLARYLASQLWGISASDPWTVVAVVLLIFVAGTGACFLPAWRAAHLDPLIALRYQ